MLFRTLTKQEFRRMVEAILENNEVIGPKRVGADAAGAPLHQFLPVARFDEMDLGYETTEFSPKTYFLPYRENLSQFDFTDHDWKQEIKYRIQPRAIVGMHACDINGLLKLDKVFIKDRYPSPYYVSRRQNTLVIGVDHEPGERCFCRSVGADTVERGFDLFLSDLGDRYFVSVGSDKGYNLIGKVKHHEITTADSEAYLVRRKQLAAAFKTQVNVANLPAILDIEFDSPVWKKWGSKCLSCGSCAMVCPTCYCYGVHEDVSMDFTKGQKVKQLHSCNLLDFALVAGNHNFRPSRESRLKYRYYHQHRGFVEAYDEPKCVGCNRCGRTCLAGINPPDVIAELQAEEQV
ncbi:MAG TPA: 4Fe-4S dicluster domain-containing protein [Polyangia bacterium]|jgi:formate hydrogenlyase subunit 6/NADH:ubiquinone oxidoreductase subunit I